MDEKEISLLKVLIEDLVEDVKVRKNFEGYSLKDALEETLMESQTDLENVLFPIIKKRLEQ